MMSALDAAFQVLEEVGHPLHYKQLTSLILAKQLWRSGGKTPAATINARLSRDIKSKGPASRFVRLAKGEIGLAMHPNSTVEAAKPDQPKQESPPEPSSTLTFPEAAEKILQDCGGPLHYKEITQRALAAGLLSTVGKTPAATMNATILVEVARDEKRGKVPRFERLGKGYIQLRQTPKAGLDRDIEHHNRSVQKQLRERLLALSTTPDKFESLISQLLVKMGYQGVETTKRTKDGGIDVRGTLIVADVIHIRLAIQAKCWTGNVHSPVVQQVRGSLGSNEQGLIITTSDFSRGARTEAERPNAAPVSLMNGEQLVQLLIEHELLVRRSPQTLLRLALDDLDEGAQTE